MPRQRFKGGFNSCLHDRGRTHGGSGAACKRQHRQQVEEQRNPRGNLVSALLGAAVYIQPGALRAQNRRRTGRGTDEATLGSEPHAGWVRDGRGGFTSRSAPGDPKKRRRVSAGITIHHLTLLLLIWGQTRAGTRQSPIISDIKAQYLCANIRVTLKKKERENAGS